MGRNSKIERQKCVWKVLDGKSRVEIHAQEGGSGRALLTQRNVEEAAKAPGIGTQTLVRWLKIPEFQDECREARRAAFGQSIARLQQGSSAAVLLKVLVDPNTPASTKVRAADSILNHGAKAMEIEDIEVRVAALERDDEKP